MNTLNEGILTNWTTSMVLFYMLALICKQLVLCEEKNIIFTDVCLFYCLLAFLHCP